MGFLGIEVEYKRLKKIIKKELRIYIEIIKCLKKIDRKDRNLIGILITLLK